VPASVHLASWPEADGAAIDEELLSATARLLETVSLGRSARRAAGLRVRQPLAEVVVRIPEGKAALHRFQDELRDELNVKRVRFLDVGEGLVVQRFKPNLPVVGRKFGRLVPALRQALERLSGADAEAAAQAVREGRSFPLEVQGQSLELGPDDVLLEASSPPGYTVAEADGLLVALNTSLTPELILEGQARDLVRFVQDARRSAELAISDRIDVTLQPAPGTDLAPLLEAHGQYLRAETLAERVAIGPPRPGAHVAEAEVDGKTVVVGLERLPVTAATSA
jgi:isoleucyl-tRNA synthetase